MTAERLANPSSTHCELIGWSSARSGHSGAAKFSSLNSHRGLISRRDLSPLEGISSCTREALLLLAGRLGLQ